MKITFLYLLAIFVAVQLTDSDGEASKEYGAALNYNTQPEKGKCECAWFPRERRRSKFDEKPIFHQTPNIITCDDDGDDNCFRACNAFGIMNRDIQVILCYILGNHNGLQASMYMRICDSEWMPMAFTSGPKICCRSQKAVKCEEATTKKNLDSKPENSRYSRNRQKFIELLKKNGILEKSCGSK